MAKDILIGGGLVAAGLVFWHALSVILPRLDFLSLREKRGRLRIPSNRIAAVFLMLVALSGPIFFATRYLGLSDPSYTNEDTMQYIGDSLLMVIPYLLVINLFLAQAEYIMIDYNTGAVRIRLNGILGILPFTTKTSLDEIDNYRDGHRTTIAASGGTVTSSTTHTLAISGRFGARDLEFGSQAVRDFAIRAFNQRA
jgi:hypothetical protein